MRLISFNIHPVECFWSCVDIIPLLKWIQCNYRGVEVKILVNLFSWIKNPLDCCTMRLISLYIHPIECFRAPKDNVSLCWNKCQINFLLFSKELAKYHAGGRILNTDWDLIRMCDLDGCFVLLSIGTQKQLRSSGCHSMGYFLLCKRTTTQKTSQFWWSARVGFACTFCAGSWPHFIVVPCDWSLSTYSQLWASPPRIMFAWAPVTLSKKWQTSLTVYILVPTT